MSTWYKTGTVAVTNGSATVTGTGTAFVGNAKVGEAFRLSGGQRLYEIVDVVSHTELTISPAYMDTTQTGQAYEILPMRAGPVSAAYNTVQSILSQWNTYLDGVLSGLFGNGTTGEPSIGFASDPNTGFFRAAADQIGAATNGIRRWLLTSTAFQVDVPITGTAVVQSNTDTVAGRIPTVGWMGLGASTCPVIDDFTAELRPGLYRYLEATSVGAPGSGASWFGGAVVTRSSNTDGRIVVYATRHSAANPRTWVGTRTGDTGALTWVEIPFLTSDGGLEASEMRLVQPGNTVRLTLEDENNPRNNYIECSVADNLVLAADESNLGADSTMQFRVDAAEVARLTSAGNLGVGTVNPSTRLHAAGPIRCGSYTVATVPNAATVGAGSTIYVTDETGGATHAASDGTNWRRMSDRAIIS